METSGSPTEHMIKIDMYLKDVYNELHEST